MFTSMNILFYINALREAINSGSLFVFWKRNNPIAGWKMCNKQKKTFFSSFLPLLCESRVLESVISAEKAREYDILPWSKMVRQVCLLSVFTISKCLYTGFVQ